MTPRTSHLASPDTRRAGSGAARSPRGSALPDRGPAAGGALAPVVSITTGRRPPRAQAAALQASALREAVENLRHTVSFLEELMMSRKAEANRALVRAREELDELRQRIRWVEDLAGSRRPDLG